MFKGQFAHALDGKGRVALPASFRRVLQDLGDDQLVVTPHIREPCLVAYPQSEWRRFEERVAQLPQFEPGATQLRRLVVGRAQDCPVDKVGRTLLPASLREVAGFEKELIWLGQLRWIELWAPSALQAVAPMSGKVPVSDETIARLTELGL